jgi:hypothetical protein
MLRYTPVLLLMAFGAQAALPVYTTDMPAKGELLANTGVRYGKNNADEKILRIGNTFSGTMESTQQMAWLSLDYGFSNRFSGLLYSTVSTFEQEEALSGIATVKLETRNEGLGDLKLGAEYLLVADGHSPVAVRILVDAPTASDYPGMQGATINGTPMAATETGAMGSGNTRVSSEVAGTVKGNQNALEWELAWQTDDEKTTEDAYAASISWVHDFNQGTYFRLTGSTSLQHGMHTSAYTVSDATNFSTSLFMAHRFTEKLKLGAFFGYGLIDDLHVTYSGGSTLDRKNQSSQLASLSLSYLFF